MKFFEMAKNPQTAGEETRPV